MKKGFVLAFVSSLIMHHACVQSMSTHELPAKKSSLAYILGLITKHEHHEIHDTLHELRDALTHNRIDEFVSLIRQFYSQIPYTIAIEKEKYYQTIFYVILRLIDLKPEVEKATNIGRIDMIVELEDRIFIFEFKLNGSASTALQQIHDMQYYQPYLTENKKIVLVGINFSSKLRNIADYLFEEFII